MVEYGALADVVVAPAEDGLPGLALVTGATASPVGSYDGTTRLASCSGGTAEALPGTTVELQRLLTDRATVLVAADLVGIAREALTRTVAYDRERTQFGVPVGSFRRSSTHWPTCTSGSRWPSTRRSTPRTRWTPGSTTPSSPSPSPRPRAATWRSRRPRR